MKTIYLPARKKIKLDLKQLDRLKGKIGLVCTVQYCHLLEQVKKHVKATTSKKQFVEGQILGCDARAAELDCNIILLLSDGEFHAIEIARKTGKPVYIFNETGLKKLDEKKVRLIEKKKWARISKAKKAKTFGFIVSLKPGQNRMKQVQNIIGNNYLFVCDSINYFELLNFPFIDCWVNTACPRITEDETGALIIGLEDFKEI
ncbi:MAG: hypothetical protein GON13_00030 [Nanoarchaeota archaeon]|nr:hypothetical protein [Nanoarchaeota archaeon]